MEGNNVAEKKISAPTVNPSSLGLPISIYKKI